MMQKDSRIMKHVPMKCRDAIREAWKDEDGYWITLRPGWNADREDWDCRTIHEWTIRNLRYQIAGITRVSRSEGGEDDN